MPRAAPQLGFVAGSRSGACLAAAHARTAPAISVKWPNDISARWRKARRHSGRGAGAFAAALCASSSGSASIANRDRPDLPYQGGALLPTTERRGTRRGCSCFALGGNGALDLDVFEQGFDVIRAEWLSLAAGIGAPIKVRTATRQFEGTFEINRCDRPLDPARCEGRACDRGRGCSSRPLARTE